MPINIKGIPSENTIHKFGGVIMDNNNQSLAFYIIRKLVIALIITISLLFASNIAWLVVLNQYEFKTVTVEQDTSDSEDCNYVEDENNIYGDEES